MFRSKSSLVFLAASLLLYSSFADAEIVLKPVGPSTFGTVTGTTGLDSETLSGGSVNAIVQGLSINTPVDSSGDFTLTVWAGSPLTISANLAFEGVPNVNMTFSNLAAISEGETRVLDLQRASGRLLGRVNVIGGTLETINVSASSSLTNADVVESFSSSGSKSYVANQPPEVVLAMPSGINTTVSGSVLVKNDQGCDVSESLAPQYVTLPDGSSNTSGPVIVEWTIDVSNATCNAASLDGTFRIDGLGSAAVLNNHLLALIGPVNDEWNPTEFGTYRFDQLIEGEYLVFQRSIFQPPFGELRYPDVYIDVTGNASYDAIHSVGIAHGQANLFGEWGYADLSSATVRLEGAPSGSPASYMSANDDIDLQTQNYDLVLAEGNWDLQNYTFNFNEEINGIRKSQFVNVNLLPKEGVTRFSISGGPSVNIPDTTFETFTTELTLVVEQQPGQPDVTIEQLVITGSAPLFDAVDDSLRGTTSLRVSRIGPQDNRFLITVYGLPGTYPMTASGRGSDGRFYSAGFEMILGNPQDPPGSGDPQDPPGSGDPQDPPGSGDPQDPPGSGDPQDPPGSGDPQDPPGSGDPQDPPGSGDPQDPPGSGDPQDPPDSLGCFGINKMKVHLDDGKSHDKIHIQKASFGFPVDTTVDLEQESVSVAVDDLTYEIPAGSFKQKGSKRNFVYKSPHGMVPHIYARLNFDKAEWNLRVKDADVTQIDNSDGVDVTLTIGNYVGTENIVMKSKDRHATKLKYKRKPKLSCRIHKKSGKK